MDNVKIFSACEYKGHWCNGKHIPLMKKTGRTDLKGYPEYSDIDSNQAEDKNPCTYLINNKCSHPKNPKTHK